MPARLRVLDNTVPLSEVQAASLPSTNVDRFGRSIDYLRISVTDRCNLRCVYCMPEAGIPLEPKENLLTFAELVRIAAVARQLGFRKFRITGGEPLVVRNIVELCAELRRVTTGAALCLTTNGVFLPELAAPLRAAGVERLNISLDTLDRQRFVALTRRDELDRVLAGLDAALAAGFERIKINAVIVPGVNEMDLLPLAALAEQHPVDVRFIEEMPLDGEVDRGFLGATEMLRRLAEVYPLETLVPEDMRSSAQRLYTSPRLRGRLGVIAPRSQKFCANCHRMRLTPHGDLKGCLLSEGTLSILPHLRAGISDEELSQLLRYAIGIKPAEYRDDRYGLDRSMSAIGG